MSVPFSRICACFKCGCVYSKKRASKCPVCNDPSSSPIEKE